MLEENLIQAWRALIGDWYLKVAEHPFQLDPDSMQRDDAPPGYQAFRESIINLLIHQDYADHTRKAVICHYPDQTRFWNPGDAFAADADLFERGEKEVRNPRLVLAFRRIGLCENAGWGLRDVFRSWRELGHAPPIIANDKGRKSFEVVLKKEALLSAEQLAFHRSLGLSLTGEQAEVFAFLCRAKAATISQIWAVMGKTIAAAQKTLTELETQQLISPVEQGTVYALAKHLQPLLDEAGRPRTAPLTEQQYRVVEVCEIPRTQTELAQLTKLSKKNFRQRYVLPLVDADILRPTNPGTPSDRGQRYVLTDAGLKLRRPA